MFTGFAVKLRSIKEMSWQSPGSRPPRYCMRSCLTCERTAFHENDRPPRGTRSNEQHESHPVQGAKDRHRLAVASVLFAKEARPALLATLAIQPKRDVVN